MPIYAYRCGTCGHAKDVLQKVSDPVLSTCPACGAPTFQKQVTAAGFQLKGSGWYVTDFRGDTKKPAEAGNAAAADGASPAAAAPEAKPASAPAAPAPAPAGDAAAKPAAPATPAAKS